MKLSHILFALASGSAVFVACAAEHAVTPSKPSGADSGLADSFHDTLAELGVELGVPDADADPATPTAVTKTCVGSGTDFFATADFPGRSKEWIAMNVKAMVCTTGAPSWPCGITFATRVQDGGMRVVCAASAESATLVTVTFLSP